MRQDIPCGLRRIAGDDRKSLDPYSYGRCRDGFIAPWVRRWEVQGRRNESANSGGAFRAPRASSAPSARPLVAEYARLFAAEYWSEDSHDHPSLRRGSGTAPEVPALARR